MIYSVCSVHDIVGLQYGRPFLTLNSDVAIRSFASEVNSPESVINQYPTDYHLYMLGEFDDSTGKFSLLDVPVLLAQGQALVTRPAPIAAEGSIGAESVSSEGSANV